MAREKMIESLEKNIENEFEAAIKAKDIDKVGKLIKDAADYQSDARVLPLHVDRIVNHLIVQGGEVITEEVKHKLGEIKDKALGAITPHAEPKQVEGDGKQKQQIVKERKDVEKLSQKKVKQEEEAAKFKEKDISKQQEDKKIVKELKDKEKEAVEVGPKQTKEEHDTRNLYQQKLHNGSGDKKQINQQQINKHAKQQADEVLSKKAFDLWNDFMGFGVYGEEGAISGAFHKVIRTSDHYGEKGKEIGIKKLNEVMDFIKYSQEDKTFLSIVDSKEKKDLLLNGIALHLPDRVLPLFDNGREQEAFLEGLEAIIKNLPKIVLSAKDAKGYNIFTQLSESFKSVIKISPQVASKMLKLIEWDMEKYDGELEVGGVSPMLNLAENYIKKGSYYESIMDQVDELVIKYIKDIENVELQGDVLKKVLIGTKLWLRDENDITEDSSHPIVQRLSKLKDVVESLSAKALVSDGQLYDSVIKIMLMYEMDLKLANKPVAANKLDEALEAIVKAHPCILEGEKIVQTLETWGPNWDPQREAAEKWIEEHNIGCNHYEQEGLQENDYVSVDL